MKFSMTIIPLFMNNQLFYIPYPKLISISKRLAHHHPSLSAKRYRDPAARARAPRTFFSDVPPPHTSRRAAERRRASASSAPPLPPCLPRRLASHRSPASLRRSWPRGFFSVAGYAREEGGGAAARGSRRSGVHPA